MDQRRIVLGPVVGLVLICSIIGICSVPCTAAPWKTYGFLDVEVETGNQSSTADRGTFDQHHLTIIWQKDLDPRHRVLFETSYEHGPSLGEGSFNGKIYLAKAYFERSTSELLVLRVGKFLPPFGIYNERHDATPTVIPTILPRSVYGKHTNLIGTPVDSLAGNVRAFPRFATGIWARGTAFAGDWELDYQGYLTNGRGAEANEKDDNSNKGVGGRLVITAPSQAHIGVSFYTDKNGTLNDARQSALGFDLEWTVGGFMVESGTVMPRLENLDGNGRPDGTVRKPRGMYLMLGHVLWDKTTPFAYYDVYDPDTEAALDRERDTCIGINHALTAAVYLKAEVHFITFEDPKQADLNRFIASLAAAF